MKKRAFDLLSMGEILLRLSPPDNERIVSGDAYVSGVLYGLLSEQGDYQKALRFGNASSAAKNTIPGDMPSLNRSEIETIIQDHQNSGAQREMNR